MGVVCKRCTYVSEVTGDGSVAQSVASESGDVFSIEDVSSGITDSFLLAMTSSAAGKEMRVKALPIEPMRTGCWAVALASSSSILP